jgi:hypothetical protein
MTKKGIIDQSEDQGLGLQENKRQCRTEEESEWL